MGQSLVLNYVHIVFSTKHRQEFIYEPLDQELYSYIGGICNALDCQPIQIGGYTDHIHILCKLFKGITISNLVGKIKANSSKWIKTKDTKLNNFYWQNGYACFSVNPRGVERVKLYIKNQKEHHSKKNINYIDEMTRIYEEYKVEYDINYVWD